MLFTWVTPGCSTVPGAQLAPSEWLLNQIQVWLSLLLGREQQNQGLSRSHILRPPWAQAPHLSTVWTCAPSTGGEKTQ